MEYSLFKMGVNDYTNRILTPSYVVNSEPLYNEWTDASHKKHRDIYRNVINGTFILKFITEEEYFSFIEDIKKNTTLEGVVSCNVYVNNTNEVVNTNMFIKIAPANTIPLYGRTTYDGFTVTLEEQ